MYLTSLNEKQLTSFQEFLHVDFLVPFRAILGKKGTPKLKSWADIVKKPGAVPRRQSPAKPTAAPAVKPPTPRPSVKVNYFSFKGLVLAT